VFGTGRPAPVRAPADKRVSRTSIRCRPKVAARTTFENSLLFLVALRLAVLRPLRPGIRVIELPYLLEVDSRLWQFELHIVQGVSDDLRYGEVSKPFVIRRNDKPRRVFGRTLRQRGFERLDVIVP